MTKKSTRRDKAATTDLPDVPANDPVPDEEDVAADWPGIIIGADPIDEESAIADRNAEALYLVRQQLQKGAAQDTAYTGRWHILYTPQWRSQLDFAAVEGLSEAMAEAGHHIQNAVAQSWEWRSRHLNHDGLPEVTLDWQQVSDAEWTASGSDGNLETHLPIVHLTRVG